MLNLIRLRALAAVFGLAWLLMSSGLILAQAQPATVPADSPTISDELSQYFQLRSPGSRT